ncbi:unnamed protein product [Peniophora sp. CBMAI 1063]|nr:unnamed protein product [Peniophora sp. CBMAI 1063]
MPLPPHQVYSEELGGAFRRGHPIADPHPGIRDGVLMRPVSIGDVGYIHPTGGDFIRLFNVHLEPGVDGQPDIDSLPDDFHLPVRDIRVKPNNTTVWVSKNVTRKGASAEVSGPFFGGSAKFESSSERGAILATPDPIDCSDALHILSYKLHAERNFKRWVQYARDNGHDIVLDDLILVTGVDHTTSWATAVFTDTRLEAGFGLNVQFANAGAGVQLACDYSWQSTSSALVNSGPTPMRLNVPSGVLGPSASAINSTLPETATSDNTERRPINTVCNQSLFIRHLRAKSRPPWLGIRIEANGRKQRDDRNEDDDGPSGGDISSPDSMVITSSPERRAFVNYLNPVLDHILDHSDADFALAHDEDLALLPASDSAECVVVVRNGVGTIQKAPTPVSGSAMEVDEIMVESLTRPASRASSAQDTLVDEPVEGGEPGNDSRSTWISSKEDIDWRVRVLDKITESKTIGGSGLDQSKSEDTTNTQENAWNLGQNNAPMGQTPRQRRRSAALSCAECRRLKLRCSRVFPCNSCVKKGCAHICPNGSLTTGQGNRFILANSEVLHDKIHELAARVRQLEDALRESHSYVSKDRHPLLTDELLQIKRPLEHGTRDEVPSASSDTLEVIPESGEEAEDTLDAVGSLVISDDGKANFFGTTANAWYYLQNEGGDEDATNASDNQPWLSRTFPFALTVSETVDQIRAELWNNLPGEDDARQLVENYYLLAGWMYRPVEPDDLWVNVFNPVYRMTSDDVYDAEQSHRIAVLYLMFALAELLNLERTPYSKEADFYYKLARTALAVDSVLEEQSVQAIQALVLMCHYMFFAEIHGPRWTLMGLVVKLAQSMGLHRDSLRWKMGEDEAKKRRALLWEVVSYDSWQSLTYGRPPSMSMVHVDSQFPEAPFKNERGETDMSFDMWKHRFVENVQTQVHDLVFCAKPASYKVVLELDNKVRKFPFPPTLQIAGFGGQHVDKEPPPVTRVMQRYIAHVFWEMTIFYMHRGFFARAIEDSTKDPISHKYSQSVLAATTSACTFVSLIESLFSQYPRITERMWFLFTHVFSCAVVLGSVAIKCPQHFLARNALVHLDKAIAMYEHVLTPNAAKVLPVLRKLRERAVEAKGSPLRYTIGHNEDSERQDEELAVLGGKTRLISRSKIGPTLTSPAAITPSSQTVSPSGQGSTAYSLRSAPGYYVPQSASASPDHQQRDSQPRQLPQQVGSQPMAWKSGYEQNASSDQMQYGLSSIYDQTTAGIPQINGQPFVTPGGSRQHSDHNYGSFPQQLEQGQVFDGQDQDYEAHAALASGSYFTSPATASEPDSHWRALYSQWAPE